MKNSKAEKQKFPFLVDVRDYRSNSMFVKNNQNKPNDGERNALLKKADEKSDSNPFDLFAHILEGQTGKFLNETQQTIIACTLRAIIVREIIHAK